MAMKEEKEDFALLEWYIAFILAVVTAFPLLVVLTIRDYYQGHLVRGLIATLLALLCVWVLGCIFFGKTTEPVENNEKQDA
jgi:glucan phosphoethanolaminetransferase (alkaline phosphatase superfamily)